MKIGELSTRTGVRHRMLRYYEQQGLLDTQRGSNGYRSYGEDAPVIVAQIRGLLAAGIPTHVIRDIQPCARGAAPTLTPCPDLISTLRTELAGVTHRLPSTKPRRPSQIPRRRRS
jgi:DNA-binding transcriptional MerR regulator